MIKNIIFDFGDVFINLDKQVVIRELQKLGSNPELTPEMISLNNRYEVGGISSEEFVSGLNKFIPYADSEGIERIWNSMLLDFPDYRLEFIENLSKAGRYRLFLLSNTNALHILYVEKVMGSEKFNRFKNAFEKFYLSHEIKLRKPHKEIYRFVLEDNQIMAEETLFIDDTSENTETAEKLGINCWNLKVGLEDITDLNSRL